MWNWVRSPIRNPVFPQIPRLPLYKEKLRILPKLNKKLCICKKMWGKNVLYHIVPDTALLWKAKPQARPFHQNDREAWRQSTWWYDGLPCSFISWPPRSEDRPLIPPNDQSPLWFFRLLTIHTIKTARQMILSRSTIYHRLERKAHASRGKITQYLAIYQ